MQGRRAIMSLFDAEEENDDRDRLLEEEELDDSLAALVPPNFKMINKMNERQFYRSMSGGEPPYETVLLEHGEELKVMPLRWMLEGVMKFASFRQAVNNYLQNSTAFIVEKGMHRCNLNGSQLRSHPLILSPSGVPVLWYLDGIDPSQQIEKRALNHSITGIYISLDIDEIVAPGFYKYSHNHIMPFALIPKKKHTKKNLHAVLENMFDQFARMLDDGVEVSGTLQPHPIFARPKTRIQIIGSPVARIYFFPTFLIGDNPAKAEAQGTYTQLSSSCCNFCKAVYTSQDYAKRIPNLIMLDNTPRTLESDYQDYRAASEANFTKSSVSALFIYIL
jgi:hypothetical protein